MYNWVRDAHLPDEREQNDNICTENRGNMRSQQRVRDFAVESCGRLRADALGPLQSRNKG